MSHTRARLRRITAILALLCVLLAVLLPLAHYQSGHQSGLFLALIPVVLYGLVLTIQATWTPRFLVLPRACLTAIRPTCFQLPPPHQA